MKITKKQLKRIIREAMPVGGVPDVVGAVTGFGGEENRRTADDYVRSGDNIDDFRAPPGQVGSELARRIGIESALYRDTAGILRSLKTAGYSRKDVEVAMMNVIEMFFTGKR